MARCGVVWFEPLGCVLFPGQLVFRHCRKVKASPYFWARDPLLLLFWFLDIILLWILSNLLLFSAPKQKIGKKPPRSHKTPSKSLTFPARSENQKKNQQGAKARHQQHTPTLPPGGRPTTNNHTPTSGGRTKKTTKGEPPLGTTPQTQKHATNGGFA